MLYHQPDNSLTCQSFKELIGNRANVKVFVQSINFHSSDGRVVRASSFGDVVDLGLIPSRVKPITLKLVFTVSLLDAQRLRDSVENKSASLLVVPLGKALGGITPSWCGRQIAGNSYASSL